MKSQDLFQRTQSSSSVCKMILVIIRIQSPDRNERLKTEL